MLRSRYGMGMCQAAALLLVPSHTTILQVQIILLAIRAHSQWRLRLYLRFFLWSLALLNVNSTIELNSTHLLAMSQSITQTLTVNKPQKVNSKILKLPKTAGRSVPWKLWLDDTTLSIDFSLTTGPSSSSSSITVSGDPAPPLKDMWCSICDDGVVGKAWLGSSSDSASSLHNVNFRTRTFQVIYIRQLSLILFYPFRLLPTDKMGRQVRNLQHLPL